MSTKRPESPLHGILLIDKPPGWTSHDVVARARRLTGQRRIGHTGTLDPMATGLLVLCLGNATRLVEYLVGHAKRYSGEIVLGQTTATCDAEGEPLVTLPIPLLADARLRTLETQFTGNLRQVPPAFSAIKVGGRRAYDLARQGQAPALESRPIVIHRLALGGIAPGRLSVEVDCGAGTYIRSLARDIGEELGCGAHLGALRRRAAGPFQVADALTLEQVEQLSESGKIESALLPPDAGMADYDAAIVGPDAARRFSHGLMHRGAGACERPSAAARIYTTGGSFLGVAEVSNSGEIRPSKVLSRSN